MLVDTSSGAFRLAQELLQVIIEERNVRTPNMYSEEADPLNRGSPKVANHQSTQGNFETKQNKNRDSNIPYVISSTVSPPNFNLKSYLRHDLIWRKLVR